VMIVADNGFRLSRVRRSYFHRPLYKKNDCTEIFDVFELYETLPHCPVFQRPYSSLWL
jgi:hypothetical protein